MNFRKNYFIYQVTFISFLVMSSIAILFPLNFSSYLNTDRFSPLWYFVTSTGGFYGGAVIIITIYVFMSYNIDKISGGQRSILIFTILIFCTQLLMTSISLIFIKDSFKNPRPSQLLLIEKGIIENREKFLETGIAERRHYLNKRIDSSETAVKDIYRPILDDWIFESGFSFPSGHAQTSFFLGTILSFIFNKILRRKYITVIPLIWAIFVCLSRIVIGIHFPVDVIGGALIGLMFGIIFISIDQVNKIFS